MARVFRVAQVRGHVQTEPHARRARLALTESQVKAARAAVLGSNPTWARRLARIVGLVCTLTMAESARFVTRASSPAPSTIPACSVSISIRPTAGNVYPAAHRSVRTLPSWEHHAWSARTSGPHCMAPMAFGVWNARSDTSRITGTATAMRGALHVLTAGSFTLVGMGRSVRNARLGRSQILTALAASSVPPKAATRTPKQRTRALQLRCSLRTVDACLYQTLRCAQKPGRYALLVSLAKSLLRTAQAVAHAQL